MPPQIDYGDSLGTVVDQAHGTMDKAVIQGAALARETPATTAVLKDKNIPADRRGQVAAIEKKKKDLFEGLRNQFDKLGQKLDYLAGRFLQAVGLEDRAAPQSARGSKSERKRQSNDVQILTPEENGRIQADVAKKLKAKEQERAFAEKIIKRLNNQGVLGNDSDRAIYPPPALKTSKKSG